jgi:hypothetical protein
MTSNNQGTGRRGTLLRRLSSRGTALKAPRRRQFNRRDISESLSLNQGSSTRRLTPRRSSRQSTVRPLPRSMASRLTTRSRRHLDRRNLIGTIVITTTTMRMLTQQLQPRVLLDIIMRKCLSQSINTDQRSNPGPTQNLKYLSIKRNPTRLSSTNQGPNTSREITRRDRATSPDMTGIKPRDNTAKSKPIRSSKRVIIRNSIPKGESTVRTAPIEAGVAAAAIERKADPIVKRGRALPRSLHQRRSPRVMRSTTNLL